MHSYFHRAIQKQARKLRSGEGGFTLIELLITISLVAVLTGVVLLSLNGFQDTGEIAATDQEADAMNAAQIAFCSRFGRYGTDAELLGATTAINTTGTKFLAKAPTKNISDTGAAISGTQGKCPGSNFGQAQSSYSIHPTIPAATTIEISQAANLDSPFGVTGAETIAFNDSANGAHSYIGLSGSANIVHTSVASGTEAAAIASGASQKDIFFSADESNINRVVPKNQGGTCDTAANVCPGIGGTKRHYTTGKLVVVSCNPTPFTTLASVGAEACGGAPLTVAPPNGAVPPRSAAHILALLRDTAGHPTNNILSIANPNLTFAQMVPTTTSPPGAPYGVAAVQALAQDPDGAGPLAGMDATEYVNWTTGANAGRISFGTNVSATMDRLEAGTVRAVMVPYSFTFRSKAIVGAPASNVECPAQDVATATAPATPATHCERNFWGLVTASHDPIKQFAVVVRRSPDPDLVREGAAKKLLDYLTSKAGRDLMTGYGYVLPG